MTVQGAVECFAKGEQRQTLGQIPNSGENTVFQNRGGRVITSGEVGASTSCKITVSQVPKSSARLPPYKPATD